MVNDVQRAVSVGCTLVKLPQELTVRFGISLDGTNVSGATASLYFGFGARSSHGDFEGRDLSALEAERVSQVDRAAREIAREPARDNVSPILRLHGEGLAGVRVLR